jgi:hypothetical protein
MSIYDKITEYIQQDLQRVGLSASYNYQPVLGFKLSNHFSSTSNCFAVSSVDEAEDIVISFIPTAVKGAIFINDVYDESKPLFLLVLVVLPT